MDSGGVALLSWLVGMEGSCVYLYKYDSPVLVQKGMLRAFYVQFFRGHGQENGARRGFLETVSRQNKHLSL